MSSLSAPLVSKAEWGVPELIHELTGREPSTNFYDRATLYVSGDLYVRTNLSDNSLNSIDSATVQYRGIDVTSPGYAIPWRIFFQKLADRYLLCMDKGFDPENTEPRYFTRRARSPQEIGKIMKAVWEAGQITKHALEKEVDRLMEYTETGH